MSTSRARSSAPGPRPPRITLVTPSFNQAGTLEATLRSVLDQGYPNLEYIVVDGGSTDGSVEILERYSDRLAWWVSEPDGGHGDAINKGFGRSSGELMGWINSDDVLLPGSLRLVGNLFAEFPEMEWLTSSGAVLDEGGSLVEALSPRRWTRAAFLTSDDRFLQQESTFWIRSLWERAGGKVDENLVSCDHELWARFFRTARLFQTRGLIGAFRHRSDQRSVVQRARYVAEVRSTLERERSVPLDATLSASEALLVSELLFDPATLRFVRHDSRNLLRDEEAVFLHLAGSVAETVSLAALRTPTWGLESTAEIRNLLPVLSCERPRNFVLLWLGCGEEEGLRLTLESARAQDVEISLTAAPGPARPDHRRTLRLATRPESGRPWHEVRAFDAERRLSWRVPLATGRNDLVLAVEEVAAVGPTPGGEQRQLMAVVSALEIASPATG